ncbi:hypothetical protein GINT2_001785 [Glugoides intestinalis]
MASWSEKYRPKKFTELHFSDDAGFKLLSWLRKAGKGSVLNLCGALGKTCLVYTAAKALNFNVINYDTNKELSTATQKNLSNLKNLLVVDESDIATATTPQKIASMHLLIPIIIVTSNSVFPNAQPSVETIRLSSIGYETILKTVKNILRAEKKSLSDKFILRLCEWCNGDIRSIINYAQLYSSSENEIKDLRIIERTTIPSITSACRSIFNKRLSLNDLNKLYSEKMMRLCLRSALEKSNDKNILKAIESISELSIFPEKFRHLSLDFLNRISADFVYIKEEEVNITNKHDHEDPLNFLPLYHRDMHSSECIKHLQEVFRTYKLENLTGIDKEINDYVEMKSTSSNTFKYKYSFGSSAAVRKDVCLKEFLGV